MGGVDSMEYYMGRNELQVHQPSRRHLSAAACSGSNVGKKAFYPMESVRYDEMNNISLNKGSKKSCKLCKKLDTHTFCTHFNVHFVFLKAKTALQSIT